VREALVASKSLAAQNTKNTKGRDVQNEKTDSQREPSAEPLVRVRDLHKSFGGVEVLCGIDADFQRGEKVAIIGASGSGKSTLLRLLMTLERPDAGTIEVEGERMWTMRKKGSEVPASEQHVRRVRGKLGMVFQHFNLFPHMTVLENVTAAPRIVLGLSAEQAAARAHRWLALVGLDDKVDSHPARLSGGQKQRVAIARALAMEPKVMLFDEITSGLDPLLVGEVLNALRELAHESDVAMLLVTHQMDFAREIGDRVVFIDAGKIVEEGEPERIFRAPRHGRTREFLASIL
jgi:polar amino acid transport system ATP-binding protein